MKKIIIVGSITNAYRARDILNSKGMNAYIQRVSSTSAKRGCGYGIFTKNGNINDVIDILSNNGIKIQEVLELDK